MSKNIISNSFVENLIGNAVQNSEISAPVIHSEIKLTETKSKIPIKICKSQIKIKSNISTVTDLVCDPPEQTTINVKEVGKTQKSTDIKRRHLVKKELNPQELFKARVPRALTKSEHVCRTCKFREISKPRSKMPLVVIDFDAITIKLTKENSMCAKLTILDLFEDLYPYYNIGTWSSLRMKEFLEYLEEFNLLRHRRFQVCFCLDITSMISAFVPKLGNTKVKALDIVWNLYPQFNQNNSVMIDESLKNIIFNHYNISTVQLNDNKHIKISQINLFAKYLIDFFLMGQVFTKINMPRWRLSWNDKL